MCQATPGKLIEMSSETLPKTGRVDFQGVIREVNLDCLAEVAIGDYVIVHAGFAINRLEQEEAEKTIALYKELGDQHG